MGAPLFVRTTRRVELTVAGARALREGSGHHCRSERGAGAVAAISGLERGTLSLGTCGSLNAFFDLPLLLGEFHALHPSVEITLCHGTATELMEKVKDGQRRSRVLSALREEPRDRFDPDRVGFAGCRLSPWPRYRGAGRTCRSKVLRTKPSSTSSATREPAGSSTGRSRPSTFHDGRFWRSVTCKCFSISSRVASALRSFRRRLRARVQLSRRPPSSGSRR